MYCCSEVQMYCPNCGRKVTGHKRADGAVWIKCSKCSVSLFSKQKNKREIDIKVISTPVAQTI